MAKIERHPAPEKLLMQVTREAINALELGGADRIRDAAPLETGVDLIVKAWGLPQELHQASVDLIQKEKELVRSGSREAALPDSEMLEAYDDEMIVELLWGLFETTVKLDNVLERAEIHKLAILMAEGLNLDSWIAQCGPAATAKK